MPGNSPLGIQDGFCNIGQNERPASIFVLSTRHLPFYVDGTGNVDCAPFDICPAQAHQLPRTQAGQDRESVRMNKIIWHALAPVKRCI